MRRVETEARPLSLTYVFHYNFVLDCSVIHRINFTQRMAYQVVGGILLYSAVLAGFPFYSMLYNDIIALQESRMSKSQSPAILPQIY